MHRDAQAARLSRSPPYDAEEADAAREVPRRDGRCGALGAAADADRATLPKGRSEDRLAADAAGEDTSGLLSPELVCAHRPDGG